MRRGAGPAAAVVVALLVTGGLALRDGDRGGDGGRATQWLAVTSDAPRYTSLDELVAASDVVVRATAGASRRGRTFGDPGGAAIESRLVELAVTEVLRGDARLAGTEVLLEEEGWLADGRALVVDGLAPAPDGATGMWFLIAVPAEAPTYIVVGAQGRYLEAGDGLVGADGDDPLVTELAALGPGGLARAVRAVDTTPAR